MPHVFFCIILFELIPPETRGATLFLADTEKEQPTPFVLFLCRKMDESSIEVNVRSLVRN